MSREAMKQALEALELLAKFESPSTKWQVRKPKDGGPIVTIYPHKVATDAATLLRERLAQPEKKTCLVSNESCKHGSWCSEVYCQEHCKFIEQSAQPEQEPVAWANESDLPNFDMKVRTGPDLHHTVPLYTAPPKREWVGLTGNEARKLYDKYMDREELIHAIDKFLEEKNNG